MVDLGGDPSWAELLEQVRQRVGGPALVDVGRKRDFQSIGRNIVRKRIDIGLSRPLPKDRAKRAVAALTWQLGRQAPPIR